MGCLLFAESLDSSDELGLIEAGDMTQETSKKKESSHVILLTRVSPLKTSPILISTSWIQYVVNVQVSNLVRWLVPLPQLEAISIEAGKSLCTP